MDCHDVLHAYLCITDVTAVIDNDELTARDFDVKVFVHHKTLPDVVSINSACELSNVFIDAKSSQFGQKGMHIYIAIATL